MSIINSIPVIKRLYPAVMKKIWTKIAWTDDFKIKRYNGLLWLLNWRNFVDRQVGLLGGYEKEQVSYLLSKMSTECDCFIDIGANFGLYSLQVAKSGYASEIHAFEPDPRNLNQLAAQIYLNKMQDIITVHPLALSDKAGMIEFELQPDKSTGQTKVATNGAKGTSLMASTVDEMFKLRNKKIFLKIDVEGHEAAVFKGAEQLLANNPCFIQVELWQENALEIREAMKRHGYKQTHQIDDDCYFTKE